jgi:hypothetical protein
MSKADAKAMRTTEADAETETATAKAGIRTEVARKAEIAWRNRAPSTQ